MTRETKRLLLGLCAVGLVWAAFMREWLVNSPVFAGLWGVEVMGRGERWDNVAGAQEDLYLAGYLAFALSLVAAVLIALILFGKAQLARVTRKILLIDAIAMGWFVLDGLVFNQMPGSGPSFMIPVGLGAAIGGRYLLRDHR